MRISYLNNLLITLKFILFRGFCELFKLKHLLLFLIFINISNNLYSQASCSNNSLSAFSPDPTCSTQARTMGAGDYANMSMVIGVTYQFNVTNSSQSDGVCAAGSPLGTGTGPFYHTAAGTTVAVAVHRTAAAYTSTSATLNYIIATPAATNTSTATINDGLSTTLAGNIPNSTSRAVSGAWTVVSGPSTASSQFASTTTYNTSFTPIGGPGSYVVRWTLTNSCNTHAADATITVNASLCGTGSLQADYAAPVCSPTTFGAAGTPGTGVGGGERKQMYFYNGFNYTFSLAKNSNTQINGLCINNVNVGVGTGPWNYTHTGADGLFEVSPLRTSTTWSTQSAQLTYEKLTCTTITLAANTVAAANVCASSTKVPIQSFSGAITVGNGNLTNVGFTTTGTYAQADITKYQLWYNTTNNLGTATQVGVDLASSGGAGARSFAAFTSPTLTNGSTYYFWITVDAASSLTNATIACNATATSNLTYAGTVAGSTTAGGTQTFNGTITLAANTVSASNICTSALKVPIQSFSLAVTTCNGNLTAVGFTTTGTYAQADIAKYQLWKSATNDITTATQLGVDLASSGTAGARSFAAFASPTLTSGTTYYFWITVDIVASPTTNNTIACNATATGDLTSTSTKAGSTSAGGTKTLYNATITLAANTVSASTVCASATKVPIQSFSTAVTACDANLTAVAFTTTGTYLQAEIVKYQLWKSATNDIATATQLGVDLASSGTAGARSFAAFASPTLTSGTTYYFWITIDVATGSTTNTIACNATATGDLTSTSTKAGSTSAGGTKTILLGVPAQPSLMNSD